MVSYIDLALDLWVAADGTQTVLDEDEFLGLSVDVITRAQAVSALEELKQKFANKRPSM
jgi:predicted RNA-binding protein associated with RNAse of E/G family